MDDLRWVRWKLDRLVSSRLLGRLSPELEAEYERLTRVERRLIDGEADA